MQDLLIDPGFQRKGLATKLVSQALERFKDVRTHLLLTDDEQKQDLFYRSLGYCNLKDEKRLNVFIQMRRHEV